MSDLTNRQVVLRKRPTGLVQPGDTELIERPVPELAEGEALVRNTYLGIDAAVRTWLDDQRGYLPPVQLGEPVRAAGVAEVVATRCDAYAVGDVVTYPGKKKLILCGFHEATLAAFAALARLRPDEPQLLQYTTTSPRLHQRLGVATPGKA